MKFIIIIIKIYSLLNPQIVPREFNRSSNQVLFPQQNHIRFIVYFSGKSEIVFFWQNWSINPLPKEKWGLYHPSTEYLRACNMFDSLLKAYFQFPRQIYLLL